MNTLIDFITGKTLPDTGAEGNRQLVERLLVTEKGYPKTDIVVDYVLRLETGDSVYISTVDLVVYVKGKPYMALKCAPGSLDSRQREIVAAARLLTDYQLPLAVASSGKEAIVWDTVSGRQVGEGLAAIPTLQLAEKTFDPSTVRQLPADRRRQVQLVYRSYDSMNINKTNATQTPS